MVQVDDKADPPLMVRATNEYGEFDRVALTLYDLEMVLEPYRETTLTVTSSASDFGFDDATEFQWRMQEANDDGEPLKDRRAILDTIGGVKWALSVIFFTRSKPRLVLGTNFVVSRVFESCLPCCGTELVLHFGPADRSSTHPA